MHKTGNVLNDVAKSAQPKRKQALHDIWQAETRENGEAAFERFETVYEVKYPKAVHCLQKDRDELLAFYDFPAQHWQSLRTTNPIESTFGTTRHRTKPSKACLLQAGLSEPGGSMLHMIFKLGECAEKNWRKQRGFNYLAKVVQGITFKDGEEVTRAEPFYQFNWRYLANTND